MGLDGGFSQACEAAALLLLGWKPEAQLGPRDPKQLPGTLEALQGLRAEVVEGHVGPDHQVTDGP
jgi:hypothetical protein